MRKYLFGILVLGLAACGGQKPVNPQEEDKNLLSTNLVSNPASANGTDSALMHTLATMDFKDTMHNFGTMREGETVFYDFEFTNNGKNPLIINNALGSCGCTVPEYPHEPIEPGKSAIMKVSFNSTDKQGHQEKSVTITTNSTRGTHMLYIKADVKAADKN